MIKVVMVGRGYETKEYLERQGNKKLSPGIEIIFARTLLELDAILTDGLIPNAVVLREHIDAGKAVFEKHFPGQKNYYNTNSYKLLTGIRKDVSSLSVLTNIPVLFYNSMGNDVGFLDDGIMSDPRIFINNDDITGQHSMHDISIGAGRQGDQIVIEWLNSIFSGNN